MTAPVHEGEVLAGKYRVERVLGRGGMGVVVAARHVALDEFVALKFLLPEASLDPEQVARFLKEARAAVRIKNEHVARVLDVGQLESGAPYIVMEYLEGSDLGALVHSRGAMPVHDVADYVVQACEAIANAHALGIVHRDLKPSNLMLVNRSDGSACIKVLDFGISKIASAGADSAVGMTRTAAFLGSPPYVSPEQMMSAKDVDERTDVWALGAILYELLTGRPPFAAETLPALGVLIATSEPVSIRVLRPEVPPALQAIVARCLMKHRDDRFANVAELALALAPFAPEHARVSVERAARVLQSSSASAGKRAHSPPTTQTAAQGEEAGAKPAAAAGHSSAPTATASSWGHTAPSSLARRRRLVLGAGALVMAATAATAAVIALSGRAASSTLAASSAALSAPPPLASAPVSASTPLPMPTTPSVSLAPALDALPREESTVRQVLRPAPAPRPAASEHSRSPLLLPFKPPSAPTQKSAYDEM